MTNFLPLGSPGVSAARRRDRGKCGSTASEDRGDTGGGSNRPAGARSANGGNYEKG